MCHILYNSLLIEFKSNYLSYALGKSEQPSLYSLLKYNEFFLAQMNELLTSKITAFLYFK